MGRIRSLLEATDKEYEAFKAHSKAKADAEFKANPGKASREAEDRTIKQNADDTKEAIAFFTKKAKQNDILLGMGKTLPMSKKAFVKHYDDYVTKETNGVGATKVKLYWKLAKSFINKQPESFFGVEKKEVPVMKESYAIGDTFSKLFESYRDSEHEESKEHEEAEYDKGGSEENELEEAYDTEKLEESSDEESDVEDFLLHMEEIYPDIKVIGISMNPIKILQKMDPIVFNEYLADWRDDNKGDDNKGDDNNEDDE